MPEPWSDPDPHASLVDEIAERLRTDGEYVVDIDSRPMQRLVDLQWAAYQASRRLGLQTQFQLREPISREDRTVTVRIVRLDDESD